MQNLKSQQQQPHQHEQKNRGIKYTKTQKIEINIYLFKECLQKNENVMILREQYIV